MLKEIQTSDLILPVFYSFRRCPYAMRARMALKVSGNAVQMREVVLRDKPNAHQFLMSDKVSMADIGIFPFIRQFANVDRDWFDHVPYPQLQIWLKYFIHSEIFNAVMEKYPPWREDSQVIVFR